MVFTALVSEGFPGRVKVLRLETLVQVVKLDHYPRAGKAAVAGHRSGCRSFENCGRALATRRRVGGGGHGVYGLKNTMRTKRGSGLKFAG